jgi:CRISPR-associated endonuclease/helicase Cas3
MERDMPWYAHSLGDRPEAEWETQREHAERVAEAAARRADKFGMGPVAEAAGWLHDLGKYTPAFQEHIAGRCRAAAERDHSSAGAVYARNRLGKPVGALVAHVVAGHHAGLKDALLGEDQRLDRREAALGPVVRAALADGFPFPGPPPPELAARLGERSGFALALMTRMLFSCLVDADRAETRASERERRARAGLPPAEEDEPAFTATPAALAAELERTTEARDAALRREGKAEDAINRLRARVRDHVAAQASLPPGVFTLTVPTGGGKTLTSLRFALDHARANGLDRVLVIIPFTSVIEQAADVYREALPAVADQILEHHSGFSDGRVEQEEEGQDGTSGPRRRLVAETWAAPLVLTTAVQFFGSLFGARATQCRKLHNIARSVIVLDEAQTMPLHLLRPCVAALKALQRSYGCSVVLSTATQPALEDRPEDKGKRPEERRSFAGGFVAPRELAPEPRRLFEALDRVTIKHAGALADAALVERMGQASAALCIVNSRAHARELYEALTKAGVKSARHLSTLMLPEHRRRVLAGIKADLKAGRPCHVASTSLVEAGVDFSFPLVLRAEAGLEQIVQAAGRANRNGELGPGAKGEVLIFEAAGRKPLAAMTANIEVAREVMRHHARPQMPEAIEAYYRHLYHRRGLGELDRPGVIETCRQKERTLAFPFEQIAKDMRFIEDLMTPIIVPIDPTAEESLKALEHADRPGRHARRLQRYTVGLPPRALSALIAAQAARVVREDAFGEQFVALADLSLYRGDVGLTWDDPTFLLAVTFTV